MRVSFEIPGQPLPQERPFVTRHGTFDRPRSKAEKARIRTYAMQYRFKNGPVDDLIGITVKFHGARANSDSDNLFKLCTDSLEGLFWKNDRQIKEIHIFNLKSEVKQTSIQIWTLEDK